MYNVATASNGVERDLSEIGSTCGPGRISWLRVSQTLNPRNTHVLGSLPHFHFHFSKKCYTNRDYLVEAARSLRYLAVRHIREDLESAFVSSPALFFTRYIPSKRQGPSSFTLYIVLLHSTHIITKGNRPRKPQTRIIVDSLIFFIIFVISNIMHYFYSYQPNANTVFLYGSLHTDEPLIAAGLQSSSTFWAQQDSDPHDPLTGDMMSFRRWLEEVSAFAERSEMNPGYHPEPVPLLTSGLPAGWPSFSTTLTTGTVPIEQDPVLYDSNGVLDHGASPSDFQGDLLPFMPTPNPIKPTESSQDASGYTLPELSADGDWLFGPLGLNDNPTQVYSRPV